ncbi:MAG: ABC transporter permease subunit [Alphaproteobacteria bacterium]|jgi:peptide/nickel transport system permease protein|nr:ABC transporter permease subunit [Alphaproteobacteria bacterium]
MTDAVLSPPEETRPLPRWIGRPIGLARRSPTAAIGFLILLVFGLLAVFAPVLMPHDPVEAYPREILTGPNAQFWFGTDGNGMDVFSRVIYGARYAFGIAIPAVILAIVIGVPLGLWTGYVGGYADEVTMRVFDALRVFPSIILALAVVAATGQSLVNVVLVIGILDSPIFARVVRSEVLALRSSTFVESAVAAGNPTRRIMFVHLLPNAIQGAMAQTAVRAAWAVRISATLAFLGVGIQAPTPEWGAMIRQGAEFMITGQWWVALFPGLALIVMVLGLNMLGDGLQDLLNPRRKG